MEDKMMHPATLEQMSSAGQIVTVSNPSREDLKKLLLHYGALKFQGHGIASNEDRHGDGSMTITFLHYKTCRRCSDG